MKKVVIILISFVLLSLPCYSADWFEVTRSKGDSTIIYLDRNSLKKDGEERAFWIKTLYKKKDFYLKKQIWYTLIFNKINCKDKTFCGTDFIIYGLDNTVLDAFKGHSFKPIAPDTTMDGIANYVCKPKVNLLKEVQELQEKERLDLLKGNKEEPPKNKGKYDQVIENAYPSDGIYRDY